MTKTEKKLVVYQIDMIIRLEDKLDAAARKDMLEELKETVLSSGAQRKSVEVAEVAE